MNRYARNPHPGVSLKDILENNDISQADLAKAIKTEPETIANLLDGKAPMTPVMDKLLTQHLGLSDGFFMGLHADWVRVEMYRMRRVFSIDLRNFPKPIPAANEAAPTGFSFRMVPEPGFCWRPKAAIGSLSDREKSERPDGEPDPFEQLEHA